MAVGRDGLRRARFALVLSALLVGPAVACPEPGGHTARLAALDARLELALDSGTRLRLWGIEAPAPDAPATAEARTRLEAWLRDAALLVTPLASVPDRWGRIEAHVFAPVAGRKPLSVAAALVDAGLARVRPEAEDPACLASLLRLETAARDQRFGLWADARHRPIEASDRSAFEGRSGEWVIVEGVVQSQNATSFATFLNFGPIRTVDFAVTIRRALLVRLEAAGHKPDTLVGRRIRVRGLLDARFGPQIELDSAGALELINGTVAASPYSGP